MTRTPNQLIRQLPPYELGDEYKIHLKRPGTLARLEFEAATPHIPTLLNRLVGAHDDEDGEVRMGVEEMRAIHAHLLSLVTRAVDARGMDVDLPDGWLDDAGPTVATSMLYHVRIWSAVADQGLDPMDVIAAAERALDSEEE